jgi:hypothetical protein
MKTEFLPFATGVSANVETQSAYASDASRTNGYSSGILASSKLNKSIRQGSFIASAIATWLSNVSSTDVNDDGDLSGLVTKMTNWIAPKVSPAFTGTPTAPTASQGTNTTQIATTAFVASAALGVGQTWQDFTASRAVNTSYTNGTGKPINVQVAMTTRAPGWYTWTVNGVLMWGAGTYGTTNGGTVNFIVPPGHTYQVGVSVGTPTLVQWVELR